MSLHTTDLNVFCIILVAAATSANALATATTLGDNESGTFVAPINAPDIVEALIKDGIVYILISTEYI